MTLDSFCQRYLDSYGIFRPGLFLPGTHSLHRPQGPERVGSPGGVCLCPRREVPLSQPGGGALSAAPGRNCRTALQHPHRRSAVSHPDALRTPERAHLQGAGPGKNGYYPTEFGDRRALELGIRRKRYLIPPTQYEDGREDAPTLLRRAMADYRRGEAELPGLVNGIFLGDRVQFDTGREWLVIRVQWKQSGSTARTHLELADPTYADLYG